MQSSKTEELPLLKGSFFIGMSVGILGVLSMAAVRMWTEFYGSSLMYYGILPRSVEGLKGIFLSIWIHADWSHLGSNALPLVVMSGLLHLYFPHRFPSILIGIYILSGVYTWCLGRAAYHIGASGLLYGLAVFIFSSGLFRRKPRYLAMSLLTVFLYGSLVWGLLPFDTVISWEAHLAGSISGIILAFVYRKDSRPEDTYEFEWQKPDYIETFDPEASENEQAPIEEPPTPNVRWVYTFKPNTNEDSAKP